MGEADPVEAPCEKVSERAIQNQQDRNRLLINIKPYEVLKRKCVGSNWRSGCVGGEVLIYYEDNAGGREQGSRELGQEGKIVKEKSVGEHR